jgi:glycosyltransferase involved in cell wall biosynthesis
MRVAVIAEYYPRPSHPGLGVWAHRQACAVRDLGAEVRTIVLERPIPPLHALRALGPGRGGPDSRPLRDWLRTVRNQPREVVLDGIPVRYVRFVAPPRPVSYGSWGRWAAPPVRRALGRLWADWPFDLVHAHYAVPAGDAALRWMGRTGRRLPLAVSVHGGDLTYAAPRSEAGWRAVAGTLRRADAVIVNSTLTREGVERLIGPREQMVVIHPGADPFPPVERPAEPTLVTVANLEPHKSQQDVVRAVAALAHRHPGLRYVLVGKGPERQRLEELARSLGVAERLRFTGALPQDQARAEVARGHLHVMPSRHDGFGAAHVEAMAAGVPTIAGAGTGSEDIAAAGEGALLVRAGDVESLTRAIDRLLSDPAERERLGEAARRTAAEHFSWERNGRETMAVYRTLTAAQ